MRPDAARVAHVEAVGLDGEVRAAELGLGSGLGSGLGLDLGLWLGLAWMEKCVQQSASTQR